MSSIRTSCFFAYDQGWTQPTPSEVKTLMKLLGMSGSQVASFTGISSARTVRKWCAEDTEHSQNKTKISYAAWRLLAERLHRVQTGGDLEVEITQSAAFERKSRMSSTKNMVTQLLQRGAGLQRGVEVDEVLATAITHHLLHDVRSVTNGMALGLVRAFKDIDYAEEFLLALVPEVETDYQRDRIGQLIKRIDP